ncbi:hypothetical protein ABES02_29430 [Neobacillus pocheonensis]|uniref:hypothetical protein n=1 Tax=Neobacillus pocheonensis TaxID=363869 RepID=UPI003D2821BE
MTMDDDKKLGEPYKLRFEKDLEAMIDAISVRRGENKSDVCRRLLRTAAKLELGLDAMDPILSAIRKAVAEVNEPTVKRLAAINAKTAIAAATAMYTNVEVLGQLGRDVRTIHEQARVKAVAFVRDTSQKPGEIDE